MTNPITVSADGKSITVTNCTITFNSGFDPTTGVATIVITPAGGLGTLPGVIEGQPGQPAQLRNVNVTELANGVGTASGSVSTISTGTAGTPAIYDLNLSLHAGADGAAGTSATLNGASDLSGTPTVNYPLVCNATSPSTTFTYQAMPFGFVGVPATINDTSGNTAQRTLCTVGIAAQPYPWYPWVSGSCIIGGTANTRVDLWAALTSPSGQIIAYNDGFTGDTGATGSRNLAVNLPTNLSLAKVAANTAATIYFVAKQQNGSTGDNWTTAAATTRFTVGGFVVPS